MFHGKLFKQIYKILFTVWLLIASVSLYAELPEYPYGENASEYYHFWFLFESEKRPAQDEFIFRPFYSSYRDSLDNYTFKTFLFPLYYSQKKTNWEKWTFLFFFHGDNTNHPDTKADNDLILSPLLMWGTGDAVRENYFGFFPFFGTIKSKIAWSEINFFLFPLYVSWEYKDFKAYSVLWPLILYGQNEYRKEYRFLPFFSHKSHVGKYSHNSLFWPFFQWGEDRLDKKESTSYKMFFPFYATKSSAYGNMKSYAVLWLPVFGSLFSYGYDRRTSELNFSALFFLFQYGYSDNMDYRKIMFIPFYGHTRFASKEFTFITPLYIHLKSDTYQVQSDYHFFIPFFYFMKQYWIKEERSDIYYKFWPFFRWHKDKEGNLDWNAVSLFPIRSSMVERIWDPLWSIIEYKQFINGSKRLHLFMRTYTQIWTKNELYINVPIVFNYYSTPNRTKVEIFNGLFAFERIKKKNYYTLFWMIRL